MHDSRLIPATERFLAWATVNRSRSTVYGYRLYLTRFAAAVGDIRLERISPAMLTTWSTKFHPVQAVQRLVAWCHKEERSLRENPLSGMPKFSGGSRRRILIAGDVCRMMKSTDRFFRAWLLALKETIARPQEMRQVRPIDVRTSGGAAAIAAELVAGEAFFEIDNGKGFDRRRDRSSTRIIPISPRLGRLLVRLIDRGAAVDEPIFRNSRGRPWSCNAVRCRLRRLRDRLHLGTDRRGERVVAYTLRHTGATAAARAGLRDWTLAAVLGHASTRTTDRYVHLQAADVLAAMKGLWGRKAADRPKIDRPGSLRTRPD